MFNLKLYKKMVLILPVVFIALNIMGSASVSSGELEVKNVLIVYDLTNPISDTENYVDAMLNIVEDYKVEVDVLDEYDYKRQSVEKYDYVFVYSLVESRSLNGTLIQDLKNYKGETIWIGRNIEPLLKDRYENLNIIGDKQNFVSVTYEEKTYDLEGENSLEIIGPLDKNVEIKSTVSDASKDFPYILKTDNLHFISQFNIKSKPLYHVFSQYLKEVFGEEYYMYEKPLKENAETVSSNLRDKKEKQDATYNKISNRFTLFLAILVVTVILIFAIILIIYRRRNRKRMFQNTKE